MSFNTTTLFEVSEIEDANIEQILREVSDSLEERGYNASNQIVGYLMSGDPGYISNYKEARKKITSIERPKIIEALLRNFIK